MTQSSRRVTVRWIAVAALLGNLLLSTALSIGLAEERTTAVASLCSAAPKRDHPGKANPELLLHHCALCTVPAAPPLLRSGGVFYTGSIDVTAYPVVRTAFVPTLFRHGPVQARAPPVAT